MQAGHLLVYAFAQTASSTTQTAKQNADSSVLLLSGRGRILDWLAARRLKTPPSTQKPAAKVGVNLLYTHLHTDTQCHYLATQSNARLPII